MNFPRSNFLCNSRRLEIASESDCFRDAVARKRNIIISRVCFCVPVITSKRAERGKLSRASVITPCSAYVGRGCLRFYDKATVLRFTVR